MKVVAPQTAAEIERLKACINDLMGVVALPAIWSGGEPSQIIRTLADVLLRMLHLDLIYVRLKDRVGEGPMEMVRVGQTPRMEVRSQEISEVLDHWLGDDSDKWPPLVRRRIGDVDISVVPLRLGLQGEMGAIVAGSRRAGFPEQTERLVLSVAANQAAIGLQEARLLREQKRVANELDQHVEQRTRELAAANEELKKEIAERKLAVKRLRQEQRELKRSEELLAETQRLSSTGSFTWRALTNEITWSDQSYRIFRVDRTAPVTPELIYDRVHPEDLPTFKEQLERARTGASDVQFDFRLQLADGQIRHLHVLAHRVKYESDKAEIIGALMDITDTRKSQVALHAAQAALAHAGRVATLGEISATIAHEVNQPLAAIVTTGEASLRWLARPEPNVEKVRELTRRVVAHAYHASEIIGRIRAMASRRPLERTVLSLDDVISETLQFLHLEAQSRGVTVSHFPASGAPKILADRTQLQQVIANLVINAMQAIAQAENTSRTVTVRTVAIDTATLRCTVEDSGAGIESQRFVRLFESFFTTKDGGMGLGLPICRSIIEAHGGRITADNESAHGGARFSFTLPVAGTTN